MKVFSFIVFIGTFLISALVWNSLFFRYEARMSFLIIPETTSAGLIANEVTHTLAQWGNTIDFAENTLTAYPQIQRSGDFNLLSDQKKKGEWNRHVDIQAQDQTHRIVLRTFENNAYEAEQVLRASANQLMRDVSLFYDTKHDFSVRVFDRPYVVQKSFGWGIFWSTLFGLVASIISWNLLLRIVQGKAVEWKSSEDISTPVSDRTQELRHRLHKDWKEQESFSYVSPPQEEQENEKKEMPLFEQKEDKEDKEEIEEEKNIYQTRKKESIFSQSTKESEGDVSFEQERGEQKSPLERMKESAEKRVEKEKLSISSPQQSSKMLEPVRSGFVPSNLPIIEEDIDLGGGADEEVKNEESFKTPEEEPSNEEYKRRLNQLLSGNMID